MKKLDRHTLEECIKFIENGHFLHEDAPTARMARECAAEMRKQLMPNSVGEPLKDPEKVDSLWNVGQIRQFIANLDDGTVVRAQIVAQDGKAWNMWCGLHLFGADKQVCVRLYHDELKSLPEFTGTPDKQMYKLKDVQGEEYSETARSMRWYIESITPGGVHLKTPFGGDTHISLQTFMSMYEDV